MKKIEEKKCKEIQREKIKELEKNFKKEVNTPRLTSDYLEQTLQIV